MPPTEAECAWAAGFFDGEGCTTFKEEHREKYAPFRKILMQLVQTSDTEAAPDSLVKFHRIVEVGKITGPYYRGTNRKPVYVWKTTGPNNVKDVYGKIGPFLCNAKRVQYAVALHTYTDYNTERIY